jgi:ankyrin repeat protein
MGSQDMEGKTPLHTSFNLVTGTVLQQHRNLIVDLDADRNGMTILQFAACSNQSTFEHIHYFLQQQPQLATAPDSNGRLILHFASERGNVALMQYLCNGPSAACINFVDSTGRAPIHHAMRSKRVAAIDLLIARGADAGLVTTHGWTILHEAASRDSIAAIQHVLELLGASAEAMLVMSDLDNRTPLDVARKLNALRVVDYLEKHQGQDSHKSSLEKRAPYLNPRKHYDMIWIVVCVFVGISGLRAIVPFVLQLRSL